MLLLYHKTTHWVKDWSLLVPADQPAEYVIRGETSSIVVFTFMMVKRNRYKALCGRNDRESSVVEELNRLEGLVGIKRHSRIEAPC